MSDIEDEFAFQLTAAGIKFVREYRALSGRRFKWDFMIEDGEFLIEIQGGTWSSGKMAHNSGSGIRRDCEKLNLAQLAGWRVLHFTTDMVKDGEALATVERMIS